MKGIGENSICTVRVSDEESVVEGVYVRPGVSGPGLSVKGIGENSICTVRVPDEESVVEGGYVRPGVSGLGLSVKGIGESGNPHVGPSYWVSWYSWMNLEKTVSVSKRINKKKKTHTVGQTTRLPSFIPHAHLPSGSL